MSGTHPTPKPKPPGGAPKPPRPKHTQAVTYAAGVANFTATSKRPAFSAQTKKRTTEEFNDREGTSYSPNKIFAKAAGISIDHVVSYSDIKNNISQLMTQCFNSGAGTPAAALQATIRGEFKARRQEYYRYLYVGDGPAASAGNLGTTSRKTNSDYAVLKAKLALLEQHMVIAIQSSDPAYLLPYIDEIAGLMNGSTGNLRYGDAIINSTIQEHVDPPKQVAANGQAQYTDHFKELYENSEWELIGIHGPDGATPLSSDDPYISAPLTPISQGIGEDIMKHS